MGQFDDLMLSFGDGVKMQADGSVKGYLVRFTDAEHPDLEGEYFDKDTDFALLQGMRSPIYYHHTQDPVVGKRMLGDGLLIKDEVGVWLDGQIKIRDDYDRAIRQLGIGGKLSLSSGTASHLVEYEQPAKAEESEEPEEPKARRIKRWPLGLDASLTPTPAEPRNVADIKSFRAISTPSLKALAPEAFSVEEDVADSGDREKKITKTSKKRSNTMNLKTFESGGKYHVYRVDEDGDPIGMPVKTFDDSKSAEAYIAEEAKPEFLRVMEAFATGQQKSLEAMLERVDASTKAAMATISRGGALTPGGAVKTVEGKTLTDFIYAVYKNDVATLTSMGSIKTLSEETGPAGAYLVPETFIPELIKVDPEQEIVYPRADRQPVNGPIRLPGLSTAGQTAGRSNFMGGMYAAWTESGHVKPPQEVEFTQISLNPWELSGYVPVHDQLLSRSSIALPGLLSGLFSSALRFYRDEAFLDGTGAGQPQGIITAPGTFVETRLGAGLISYLDLVNMKGHLLPTSWMKAHWIFSISCYPQLITMQDPAGHYIWQDNARGGQPTTILDLPFVFTEKTPTLGTQGDVVLADEDYYYVAEEGGISIASSEHFLFTSNQTVFKFFLKVDGQEKLAAPIYLKDGVTQVSPFVVLGSAATT